MTFMKKEITYFTKTGAGNTNVVLRIASDRYKQGGIDKVLVASTYGETALKAIEAFRDTAANLIVVGEVIKGEQSPPENIRAKLEEAGSRVLWGTPMGEMGAFTKEPAATRIADAYRRVSEGFKVVCEITMIATSQGFVHAGEKVLAVAGTHEGADTAIVASAASFRQFTDLEVLEILCKPYSRSK